MVALKETMQAKGRAKVRETNGQVFRRKDQVQKLHDHDQVYAGRRIKIADLQICRKQMLLKTMLC